MELSETAYKVVELAMALRVENINQLPATWVHRVDEQWTIAVNGHNTPCEAEPDGCMKVTVEPFQTAVWFNGWLAGLLDPFGGVLAAGEAANEDTFIAAMERAIAKATSAAVEK